MGGQLAVVGAQLGANSGLLALGAPQPVVGAHLEGGLGAELLAVSAQLAALGLWFSALGAQLGALGF